MRKVCKGTYFQDVVAAKYEGGMDSKFEFTETGNAIFSGGEFEMIPSLSFEVGSIFLNNNNKPGFCYGRLCFYTRRVLISAKEESYTSIPPIIDGLLRVHKCTIDSLDADLSNALTPLSFLKGEGTTLPKRTIPSRTSIQIQKTLNGRITLAGVTEPEV
ncbi:hypothetical protein GIB67_042800 [Kingdonia uniflora]|uniref:Uncharacterized protein n=1 Tax=Kingdonia uniflora TaxID=39325 RepID=A0A7J7L118_9MAGN|nr:hypothetical protein GIB67_042800 [Kingdonia uniflora]